ncbi:alternative ribosome rescue aminoacyl-tRNA hydrolase ArfB [Mariniblastus fucicola]|uniref:alternative ribosome rescue aminoacyl-tRNA hydrolase ArfB n=1 Tax=Mariniblastus fucicola TaxID=980251 RepID=UPI00094655ED|nr:alternative ribosome rescue aminoacyl-tRNA hydrolase ArfB [Mariniblastus fucicola]
MLKISSGIEIPLTEFKFSYARSPGPGGQNVNKVNTKVTLKWDVNKTTRLPDAVKARLKKKFARRISKTGELIVTSHRFRDQGRNVADCLAKLREMIEAVRKAPTVRKKTKPSKASKRRRLDAKKQKSSLKKGRRPPRMDD